MTVSGDKVVELRTRIQSAARRGMSIDKSVSAPGELRRSDTNCSRGFSVAPPELDFSCWINSIIMSRLTALGRFGADFSMEVK